MTKQVQKKTQSRVRSVRAKRAFDGAATALKGVADKSQPDSAAEVRLQQLLKELDKIDQPEDDDDGNLSADDDYPGAGHRWSDESLDRE